MKHITKIHSASGIIFFIFISLVINIIFKAFIAHHVSTALYGDFSIAILCLQLGGIICLFGTENVLVRYFNVLNDSEKPMLMSWVVSIIKSRMVFFVIFVIFFAIIVAVFEFIEHDFFVRYHLSLGLLTATPFYVLALLAARKINIQRHSMQSQFLEQILPNLALLILGYATVYYLSEYLESFQIIAIYIIAYCLAALISWYYFTLYCQSYNLAQIEIIRKTKDHSSESEWAKYTNLNFINTFVRKFNVMIEALAVELIIKSEYLVGIYCVSFPLVAILYLIADNYIIGIKPQISCCIQLESSRKELQLVYNKAFKVSISVVLFVTIVFVLWNQRILSLFGEQYMEAKYILILLTLKEGFYFLFKGASCFLHYGGYEKIIIKSHLQQLCVSLVVIPVATYFYSIEGTAVSAMLITLFFGLKKYILSKKHFDFKFFVLF